MKSFLHSLALGALLSSSPAWGQDEAQLFALPETRDGRALAEEVEAHVESRRWSEALIGLQRLIEEHRGELLPPSWHPGHADTTSRFPVYPGAEAWAAQRLAALPREARELYRERYSAVARQALERARELGDRQALVAVARQWPLTAAAQSAWWTLGDLEFESGNFADAERAWARAASLASSHDGKRTAGAARRLALVRAILEQRSDEVATPPRQVSQFELPRPGEGPGPLPTGGADTWSTGIEVAMPRRYSTFASFPVLAEDTILVNTWLRLYALDPFSGEPKWITDEPVGWPTNQREREERFKGVDRNSLLLAPAHASGIAVGALQIPVQVLGNSDYQGIPITVDIPNRRLFGFDMESGRELWSHTPPPAWDGESGSFTERMHLAGPPVIAGSRVLAPCYRLQGRVDYHVGCFDLETGALLWSTALISGQRELNMFGRHVKEFSAPPLVVEGDLVVALTQLGTVAALDLHTGAVQWAALYEQIPLPRTRNLHPTDREQFWRNAPPAVVDGIVVATPSDSQDVLGIDIEDGSVLWNSRYDEFQRALGLGTEAGAINVLLGADADTLYLGGNWVSAWGRHGGIGARQGTFYRLWDYEIRPRPGGSIHAHPRAALGADAVVVPTKDAAVVLDRKTGEVRQHQLIEWPATHMGNVLLGDGMLFSLAGGDLLHGFYNWDVLVRKARERFERTPEDVESLLALAQVLERHGTAILEGGDSAGALERFENARVLLDQNARRAQVQNAGLWARRKSLVLRKEALARADLADIEGAYALLEEALPLAEPGSPAARDTLLQQELLVRERYPEPTRWLAVLAALEEHGAGLAMPRPHLETMPDLFVLEPEFDGRNASSQTVLPEDVPVGLWVHLARAREWQREGKAGRQLEDLHAALATYGEHRLGPGRQTFDLVVRRISAALDRGPEDLYEPFEQRAQESMQRAVAAFDGRELERLRQLYPHSRSAQHAAETLLEWAFAEGDSAGVARLVFESLDRPQSPSRRDARRLAMLAASMGAIGNLDLERGILDTLTENHADLRLDLDSLPRDLDAWREDLDEEPPRGEPEASFDQSNARSARIPGQFRPVGTGLLTGGRSVLVLNEGSFLRAYRSDQPLVPLWEREIPRQGRYSALREPALLATDRVLVARERDVSGFSLASGQEAWTWRAGERLVASFATHAGMCLVLLEGLDGNQSVQALDVRAGHELWNFDLPGGSRWSAPICGDGRAVFLTNTWDNNRALVVLLHTGGVLGEIQIGKRPSVETREAAWIQRRRLILPNFHAGRDRNHVMAYDLDRLTEAWRSPFQEWQELHAIARYGEEIYLIATSKQADRSGAILQLDAGVGAKRPILPLGPDERVLGMEDGEVAFLRDPYVFLLDASGDGSGAKVTAVHLPWSKRWVCSLPVGADELYPGATSLPALGTDTVALVYTTSDETGRAREYRHLLFIDRITARRLDSRVLPAEFGRAEDFELIPFGDSLFLIGKSRNAPLNLMEIWEKR